MKHKTKGPGSFGVLHCFFVAAITAAGCMFTYKLFSFMKTIKKDELAGFAFDPIITYGFVAIGFKLAGDTPVTIYRKALGRKDADPV